MGGPNQLAELLGRLGRYARQLEETHSLDEFQRQAQEVCGACELTLQQLAVARAALRETTPATWEALSGEGVVLVDVVRYVAYLWCQKPGVACVLGQRACQLLKVVWSPPLALMQSLRRLARRLRMGAYRKRRSSPQSRA